MEEREELEHVPWADLMAESEPEDRTRRTLYLVAGALGSMVLGILVARSWWAPSPPTAPVTPATTAVAGPDTSVSSTATLPLYSEADLMADPPDSLARAAIVRAEWFVTDYFTSDFEPNGSADVRAALPTGPMPAFPQDDGEGISYVEWARAYDVQEAGGGAYRVSVAFRMLGAPPDRGFSRQPVRAVDVLVGVTNEGGTAVLDLPSPARMPPGPEPVPWPDGVDDPPQRVLDEAVSLAVGWGSEPRVVSAHPVDVGWRVVLTVADGVGNRWPMAVVIEEG
ncbi:MAG TPA: hypothetical protein VK960_00230 [Acidimicrobiia bacterium]|nr:hypothetical protein [Acidimicrobiia bacterium]